MTTYHTVSLDNGVNVAYAKAGSPKSPSILLLHGFPSSSNQFRNLIPLLSDRYHVVAPDLAFFGFTTVPDDLEVSFASMTSVLAKFLDNIQLSEFIVYVFDYGAPVAYRLALERPQAFKGLIVQNGNAYTEGLSNWWSPLKPYWNTKKGSEDHQQAREKLRAAVSLDEAKDQYIGALTAEIAERVDPNAYTHDYLLNMSTPAKVERQLDLFYDYQNNVNLYSKFQQFFRDSHPPTLVVWGSRDAAFTVEGAQAYKRDIPNAYYEFFENGAHFLLETHVEQVAKAIRSFF
ncbi:hypothetical protein I317_01853 [Kwoniella heveanensis CBS 569]|nr:hypothetical protein I317_01853 [Kwoniella heveanensis CBS 569]